MESTAAPLPERLDLAGPDAFDAFVEWCAVVAADPTPPLLRLWLDEVEPASAWTASERTAALARCVAVASADDPR